jgi:hypothetical protein
MPVICYECGKEIEKHELRHMIDITVSRYRGAFGSGSTTQRVPVCEECYQRRKAQAKTRLLIAIIIVGSCAFVYLIYQVLVLLLGSG